MKIVTPIKVTLLAFIITTQKSLFSAYSPPETTLESSPLVVP
jgi:hypothetical protein